MSPLDRNCWWKLQRFVRLSPVQARLIYALVNAIVIALVLTVHLLYFSTTTTTTTFFFYFFYALTLTAILFYALVCWVEPGYIGN